MPAPVTKTEENTLLAKLVAEQDAHLLAEIGKVDANALAISKKMTLASANAEIAEKSRYKGAVGVTDGKVTYDMIEYAGPKGKGYEIVMTANGQRKHMTYGPEAAERTKDWEVISLETR